MVSVPLPAGSAPSGRSKQSFMQKPAVVFAATTGTAVFVGLAARRRVSPVQLARKDLVRELSARKRNVKKVDSLVTKLLASNEKLDDNVIGGGPWQVVHCQSGSQNWQQWSAHEWLFGALNNNALQEFKPEGKRISSRRKLFGKGESFFVTAEGTYELSDKTSPASSPIKTTITSSSLHCWGHKMPLPLRGAGMVYIPYSDDSLRVFKSKKGAVTVQIREDRLAALLLSK